MKTAICKIEEIYLDRSARFACPLECIPAPGQYLLAQPSASDTVLPVPIFSSILYPEKGFRSAPGIPSTWQPSDQIYIRGPLGRGFTMPGSARKVALVALDDSPARLLGLMTQALKQNAEVVILCDSSSLDVPEVVEVQPLNALAEVMLWSDYAGMDVAKENLNLYKERLATLSQTALKGEAQILLRSFMPCGSIADCGACAISLHHEWRIICKEGPVFRMQDLL